MVSASSGGKPRFCAGLKAEDDSLHALKRVLQTAAEIMPGRYILPDKAVVPGSIRYVDARI